MKDYEISSATLAIVPLGDDISKVYEEEVEYIIEKSSNTKVLRYCTSLKSSFFIA